MNVRGQGLAIPTLILLGCALYGCGGDDSGDAATDPPSGATSTDTGTGAHSSAPTISGAAPASATVGAPYSFLPSVSDPDGGTLTFAIANRPGWATFDATTGRLDGTPAADDIGTFAGIVISASDGTASASLPEFTITVGSAANRAPTIAGAPPSSALQGASYSFQPEAADPDGNTLTFSIENLPAWATFDAQTGSLQGTPGPGDVGTYADIAIGVSDGVLRTELAAFSISVQAVASGWARLTWTPPTTNTNGSPLTDLAGYKLYWGTTPGNYPSSATVMNPGVSAYVVENLSPNTYHFVVTAINSAGLESEYSGVWQKTIP